MQQVGTKGPATAQRVPATEQEHNALIDQAGRIKDQLRDLSVRRRELLEQSILMPVAERGSHRARIAEIDARSTALEKQLYAAEDALTQANLRGQPTKIVAQGQGSGTLLDPRVSSARDVQQAVREAVRGSVFGTAFSIFAIYMVYRGFRRFIWRRKPAPAFPDNTVQIAQLQQSIDVIALEVERISEGQRYVAKVLGDRAVGPGAAQPMLVPEREHAGARERR